MGKFIVGTFMLLGFGFYELSGGAEFEPEVRPIQQAVISTKTLEAVPTSEPAVTRAVAQAFPIEPEAEVFHASLTILDAPAPMAGRAFVLPTATRSAGWQNAC